MKILVLKSSGNKNGSSNILADELGIRNDQINADIVITGKPNASGDCYTDICYFRDIGFKG